jgi:hypothetical protein
MESHSRSGRPACLIKTRERKLPSQPFWSAKMKTNIFNAVLDFIDNRIAVYDTIVKSSYKKGLFNKSNEFTFRINELQSIKNFIKENE